MRRNMMILFAAASLIFGAVSVQAATMVKIGIVDLQGALNATAEGQAAKESLKKKHTTKQEEVDRMKADLDLMEEKIKSPVLSETAQAELKEKYLQKRSELIEFVTAAKDEEERENQLLSTRILEGLVKIAQEIAEAEKFTLILEKNGSGVIFYEDAMDITEQVVKIYNERYQVGQ
ncbi:MAG: OmpH family outer membrane protein [bacterium]|nr:OmpH family outer membrane protein [bacterium]MDT8395626.1 OmpH family outer membrane protein [bacterium]